MLWQEILSVYIVNICLWQDQHWVDVLTHERSSEMLANCHWSVSTPPKFTIDA